MKIIVTAMILLVAGFSTAVRADTNEDLVAAYKALLGGEYDKAINIYSEVIDRRELPDDPLAEVYHARGDAYAATGRDDLAERDYATARQLEGGRAEDSAALADGARGPSAVEVAVYGVGVIGVLAVLVLAYLFEHGLIAVPFGRAGPPVIGGSPATTSADAGPTPKFTEREPYEKGFSEIFEREIAPKLGELERQRLMRFGKRGVRIALTVVGTIAVFPVSIFWFNEYWNAIDADSLIKAVIFLSPVLIVVVVGAASVAALQSGHQELLRNIIVPAAQKFLGDLSYSRKPGKRFDHRRFRKLGIISRYDRATVEDLFIGRHKETDFKMVEGRFTAGGGETVFDGLLFEIDVSVAFSCRVLIGRDKGRIGNVLKGFFKSTLGTQRRVKFDDAAFEERYAVYADDADGAYALVTREFCKTMVDLAEAYQEKALGAAFVDGVFLLALPVPGNLFEPGSVQQSLHDFEEDVHEFLREITIAHRVIDYLHGDRPEKPV